MMKNYIKLFTIMPTVDAVSTLMIIQMYLCT